MDRRTFLSSNAALCAGIALSKSLPGLAQPKPADGWRTFEVVTNVELKNHKGVSRIWLPTALTRDTPYQQTRSNRFVAEGGTVKLIQNKQNALGIVSATFAPSVRPRLTLTSRVSLKNYRVDLSTRQAAHHASGDELNYFLQPTHYVPTDGIVKDTALKATAGTMRPAEPSRH